MLEFSNLSLHTTYFSSRSEQLTYIPERFANFLFGVAEVASYDHGSFDPDKVRDQLRVAFQASQVKRKKRRYTDREQKRPKKRRRRATGAATSTSSSDEDEELRDDSVFHSTLVPFDTTVGDGMHDEDEGDEEDDMEHGD